MMLIIFTGAYWPFVCFLWWTVYSDHFPIFNWVIFLLLSYKYFLYILSYKFIIIYMICKYFPSFCGLSLHFLDGVLWATKNLILMRSIFLYFSLLPCTSGVISKKPLPNPGSRRVTLILSYKNFIVLALKLRHLVLFELVIIYGVRNGPCFILLHVNIQLYQQLLLKRVFLLKTNWP